MKYLIRLMDWEAVQKDTPIMDLQVVATVNTINEVMQWGKDKGLKFRRDCSLFGGYFRDTLGTCWLIDFQPENATDLESPAPEYPRTFTVEGLIATLKNKNPKALVYMDFGPIENVPFSTFGISEVNEDKLTDGTNDRPVILLANG